MKFNDLMTLHYFKNIYYKMANGTNDKSLPDCVQRFFSI